MIPAGPVDPHALDYAHAVGWRARLWAPVLEDLVQSVGSESFRGARVLEIGYGPGLLSTFFARLGADVTGLEQRASAQAAAIAQARSLGLEERCRFLLGDLFQHSEEYDFVITKSVLALLPTVAAYREWAKQIRRLLRP